MEALSTRPLSLEQIRPLLKRGIIAILVGTQRMDKQQAKKDVSKPTSF